MKLIVGLGNPGSEYTNTRHNAGFLAIDRIADKTSAIFSANKKFFAEIAEVKLGRKKLILLKPQTFMNESGKSVQAAAVFYKISPADIVIIHDDKDIALGEYRIQQNRSSAGHNGVQSIIERLGSQNFTRLRLGIKPEKQIADTADFVLGRLTKDEKTNLEKTSIEATDELLAVL